MSQKTKKAKPMPVETFAEAFIKLMACTREEIEIKMNEVGKSATVYYQTNCYEVNTREYLLEIVIDKITDPEQALFIPMFIWLIVSEDAIDCEEFYTYMIEALTEEKQFYVFNLALSISNFAPNKKEIFWNALCRLDKESSVFGHAIVAGAKTFDQAILANEILELQIMHGDSIYNPHVNGIFEHVSIDLTADESVDFYIYPKMEWGSNQNYF